MELQDDILKGFSDAINSINTPSTEGTRSVYATAIKDESGLYVRFDGSEVNTPAISMVECGDKDRVLATWKGHTAVITGNISFPSLTRKGNIYMTMTNDGLVIGQLSEEDNKPVGYYVLIRPDDGPFPGVEVVDTQGRVVSHFGLFASIGLYSSSRVLANTSGVTIYNKDGINSAFYGDYIRLGKVSDNGTYLAPHVIINSNGFQIRNTADAVQATFQKDWARLGYYNNQHVNITSSSVDICEYSNGQEVSVAKLAAKARIGKASGQHVAITDTSVDINKGSTSYATFGTTARIGTSSGQHLNINSGSVEILNGSTSYATFGTTARIGRSNNSHVNIDSDSVDVYVGNTSYSSASFGSTTTIGRTDGQNVQITSSSINLRYKTTIAASFTEDRVTLAQGAASFSSSSINLGDSDSSRINLCNGRGAIKYDTFYKYFLIGGTSDTKTFTMSNYKNNYVSEVCLNTDPSLGITNRYAAGLQILNIETTPAGDLAVIDTIPKTSLILNHKGVYVNTMAATGDFLYNGDEVATVNDLFITGSVSKKISIGIGESKSVDFNISVPTGYSLVSVCQVDTNQTEVYVGKWSYSSNEISVRVFTINYGFSSVTIDVKWLAIRSGNKVSHSYPTHIASWYFDN